MILLPGSWVGMIHAGFEPDDWKNLRTVKTTNKHFKTFKRWCRYWQERFELSHWRITFVHRHLDDAYARTTTDSHNCVATIELSTKWDKRIPFCTHELNRIAQHELIHVLTGGLLGAAFYRHSQKDELLMENEHLVRQVEMILQKMEPPAGAKGTSHGIRSKR